MSVSGARFFRSSRMLALCACESAPRAPCKRTGSRSGVSMKRSIGGDGGAAGKRERGHRSARAPKAATRRASAVAAMVASFTSRGQRPNW